MIQRTQFTRKAWDFKVFAQRYEEERLSSFTLAQKIELKNAEILLPITVGYVVTFSSTVVTFKSTEEFLSNCNSYFKIICVSCSDVRHHSHGRSQWPHLPRMCMLPLACWSSVFESCRFMDAGFLWVLPGRGLCVVLINRPEQSTECGVPNRVWSFKADSHIACRSHAAPMPCR